ncbi:MAG: hypothetical protein M1827_003216 [Pycnora praestabilis]|nr:MAG: hypothetical protein M1827_003216 [Pycnora praestabilis]
MTHQPRVKEIDIKVGWDGVQDHPADALIRFKIKSSPNATLPILNVAGPDLIAASLTDIISTNPLETISTSPEMVNDIESLKANANRSPKVIGTIPHKVTRTSPRVAVSVTCPGTITTSPPGVVSSSREVQTALHVGDDSSELTASVRRRLFPGHPRRCVYRHPSQESTLCENGPAIHAFAPNNGVDVALIHDHGTLYNAVEDPMLPSHVVFQAMGTDSQDVSASTTNITLSSKASSLSGDEEQDGTKTSKARFPLHVDSSDDEAELSPCALDALILSEETVKGYSCSPQEGLDEKDRPSSPQNEYFARSIPLKAAHKTSGQQYESSTSLDDPMKIAVIRSKDASPRVLTEVRNATAVRGVRQASGARPNKTQWHSPSQADLLLKPKAKISSTKTVGFHKARGRTSTMYCTHGKAAGQKSSDTIEQRNEVSPEISQTAGHSSDATTGSPPSMYPSRKEYNVFEALRLITPIESLAISLAQQPTTKEGEHRRSLMDSNEAVSDQSPILTPSQLLEPTKQTCHRDPFVTNDGELMSVHFPTDVAVGYVGKSHAVDENWSGVLIILPIEIYIAAQLLIISEGKWQYIQIPGLPTDEHATGDMSFTIKPVEPMRLAVTEFSTSMLEDRIISADTITGKFKREFDERGPLWVAFRLKQPMYYLVQYKLKYSLEANFELNHRGVSAFYVATLNLEPLSSDIFAEKVTTTILLHNVPKGVSVSLLDCGGVGKDATVSDIEEDSGDLRVSLTCLLEDLNRELVLCFYTVWAVFPKTVRLPTIGASSSEGRLLEEKIEIVEPMPPLIANCLVPDCACGWRQVDGSSNNTIMRNSEGPTMLSPSTRGSEENIEVRFTVLEPVIWEGLGQTKETLSGNIDMMRLEIYELPRTIRRIESDTNTVECNMKIQFPVHRSSRNSALVTFIADDWMPKLAKVNERIAEEGQFHINEQGGMTLFRTDKTLSDRSATVEILWTLRYDVVPQRYSESKGFSMKYDLPRVVEKAILMGSIECEIKDTILRGHNSRDGLFNHSFNGKDRIRLPLLHAHYNLMLQTTITHHPDDTDTSLGGLMQKHESLLRANEVPESGIDFTTDYVKEDEQSKDSECSSELEYHLSTILEKVWRCQFAHSWSTITYLAEIIAVFFRDFRFNFGTVLLIAFFVGSFTAYTMDLVGEMHTNQVLRPTSMIIALSDKFRSNAPNVFRPVVPDAPVVVVPASTQASDFITEFMSSITQHQAVFRDLTVESGRVYMAADKPHTVSHAPEQPRRTNTTDTTTPMQDTTAKGRRRSIRDRIDLALGWREPV